MTICFNGLSRRTMRSTSLINGAPLKCIGQEICEIRVDYSTLIKLHHARGCNREGESHSMAVEAEHYSLRSQAARKGSRKLSLA
jgi:hypothetical protein